MNNVLLNPKTFWNLYNDLKQWLLGYMHFQPLHHLYQQNGHTRQTGADTHAECNHPRLTLVMTTCLPCWTPITLGGEFLTSISWQNHEVTWELTPFPPCHRHREDHGSQIVIYTPTTYLTFLWTVAILQLYLHQKRTCDASITFMFLGCSITWSSPSILITCHQRH